MEFFKDFLFGISGLSLIFWTSVIGIWHVDMFGRFFSEDRNRDFSSSVTSRPQHNDQASSELIAEGALRPEYMQTGGLFNRFKYSRRSLVVADFTPIDKDSPVNNRLYTSVLLSLGVMTFLLLTYGLHSGLEYIILPA